jgi:Flp pilus assembly protein TadD
MRSADALQRWMALAALWTGLAGCASLGEPLQRVKDIVGGAESARARPAPVGDAAASRAAAGPAPAAAAGPAPGTAAAAPPARPAPTEIEAPIDAAVQRAFDDARRALRAGRLHDAERAFKALAESHPELGGSHANLGLIYRQAGKNVQSAAAFEQAVKASPRQPVFFNQLGIAYRHNGEFAKARAAYEQAIALDAGYAAPVLNLGILHDLYLWDGKRALELYDRYLVLSPGGDATVVKWVADLKNRKPQHAALTRKEKE